MDWLTPGPAGSLKGGYQTKLFVHHLLWRLSGYEDLRHNLRAEEKGEDYVSSKEVDPLTQSQNATSIKQTNKWL